MTKKEAIELLVNNSIQAVAVYGQYDFNEREYCRIEGFKNNDKALDFQEYINRHQNNYSWCRLYTPTQAVKERNCLGYDISSNIKDDWTKEPVGLERMLVTK